VHCGDHCGGDPAAGHHAAASSERKAERVMIRRLVAFVVRDQPVSIPPVKTVRMALARGRPS
jgi:hypothetical protein